MPMRSKISSLQAPEVDGALASSSVRCDDRKNNVSNSEQPIVSFCHVDDLWQAGRLEVSHPFFYTSQEIAADQAKRGCR